jgi:glycosyltransferase involved in cell wall biosynthesis
MKVLHVYAGNLFGGIETLLVTLARERHLCPAMEPQFALCFSGRLSQELIGTGVKVHDLGTVKLRYPWQAIKARARLKAVIQSEEIDVIICHACWSQAIFGSVVIQLGQKLGFWCHDTLSGKSVLEKLAKLVRPDFAIANSHFTEQHLYLLYPHTKSQVIYAPVVATKFEQPQETRQEIRQQLGTADDTVVITQVSRLERWKGHTVSISALGLMKDLPNWEFWIVGGVQRDSEQSYLEELKQQVRELGLSERVRWLGQRNDVPQVLAASDIFCQPNLGAEPFGIVFIEALYAGLPVVTVNMGGGGEIITRECGYAVPPGDVLAVTIALQELVKNPVRRQEFQLAAKVRAHELCDPRQQMDKLRTVLCDRSN